MEAHLAQLPAELALMFRNLFGPLWEFLTDTLMGAINDVMGEVLGPMAEGVGLAKEGLGFVTGAIDDAKKKAEAIAEELKKPLDYDERIEMDILEKRARQGKNQPDAFDMQKLARYRVRAKIGA